MSTVLTNGIIIPDNGSRNWGGDLANNWNILDVHVGYMTDVKNRVTTLENSVTTLETSVTENTANIQINASNISALQTSKQDVIDDLETIRTGASAGATAVQPSELSTKANDADVVHKNGNEIISGVKNFNDVVLGEQSGVIRIGQNIEGTFFCKLYYDGRIYSNLKQFFPDANNEYNLGSPSNKWKDVYATLVNNQSPGALSLPDYSQSVSISFAVETPITIPTDGFLSVTLNVENNSYVNVFVNDHSVYILQSALKPTVGAFIPVSANDIVKIHIADGSYTGYGSLVLYKNKGSI